MCVFLINIKPNKAVEKKPFCFNAYSFFVEGGRGGKGGLIREGYLKLKISTSRRGRLLERGASQSVYGMNKCSE